MAEILIGNVKGPQGVQGPEGPRGLQGIQGVQGPMPPLANNGTTTTAGFALDARFGKALFDQNNRLENELKIHNLAKGSDIFAYADSLPDYANRWCRLMDGTKYPAGYTTSNDFWFHIIKISDKKYWRITAYDIRKNRTFSVSKNHDVISNWVEIGV